jgi:hypothetical protein
LQFAGTLARSCSRALAATVAGVIRHGSLTLGDYLPGSSDVDLLEVVDEPLTHRQLAALTEAVAGHRLGRRAGSTWEWSPAGRSRADTGTADGGLPRARAGRREGMPVERRHPRERDLAVKFSMCRAHGRSLVGRRRPS